jgi:microcystin-dependent protein
MSEPFLGEIRQVGFAFAPKGWALCNGQIMQISQFQALFSLVGTTYGGDGVRTFALPNFQNRVPVNQGSDPSGNNYAMGASGGEANHTLLASEMPGHNHPMTATTVVGTTVNPANENLGGPAANVRFTSLYGTAAPIVSSDARTISPNGSSQPHNNQQPLLVINFIIALQGIFPSRN